ncbi:uncharacterized protein LOC123300381 [Chrysoperla carnea]|uniref:uncharacterized protein LOC123300381 n=1 Tax=Chrysoperla carnea TaxID=189513 RepID=UPI001D074A3D|nr:uncharacterized protein LOC123300381 [Chrysoperla carnea]
MNENQKEIDRDQLKIDRKIRKKLKKEKVREQNQKEREKAALLKLQSTDHRIQIITENSYLNSKPIRQCSCVDVNLENDIEQFPSLNLTVKQKKIKIKQNHNENCSLNISPAVSVNKKSNAPITVDIVEVIENIKKPAPAVINKKHVKKLTDNRILLSGNILDSDNPQRRHGKIRENKKPHLSQMKKQIIKEKNCMEMCENKNSKINILCDNLITPELNSYVERLLKDIADFYYRQFQDSTKTVHKKRFIVGFHEIEKYMPTKNVKLLIIASNLQPFGTFLIHLQFFLLGFLMLD